jgi:hypothetical protein
VSAESTVFFYTPKGSREPEASVIATVAFFGGKQPKKEARSTKSEIRESRVFSNKPKYQKTESILLFEDALSSPLSSTFDLNPEKPNSIEKPDSPLSG